MERHTVLVEVGKKMRVFPWTSGDKAIEWGAREALHQRRWSFATTDSISAKTMHYDVSVRATAMSYGGKG